MTDPEARKADGPELTILMPCLDEAETLPVCLRKANAWLEASGVDGEIVIGDNGSTDGSQEMARAAGARVVDVPVRGYGAALFYASHHARGRYIIMGDSDDSYDFSRLDGLLGKLREGCELVMGNRFLGGIAPGAMPWKNRYLGNPVLTWVGRVLFRCPVSDFHCGLRGVNVESFRRMDLRTTGMEYASEMVIKATLLGMRIAEVPVTLSPDGRTREPHLRPWRDGWRHLRFMLLFSPRWLFLIPGVLVFLLGSGLVAWLLPGPRTIGGAALDVHTMVYGAALALLGHQAVLFAIGSKVFAAREGLLPPDDRIARLLRFLNLEVGILIGLLLMLLGFGGSVYALTSWARLGFGPLEVSSMMRVAIPSVLLFGLGGQTMLWSLFLGVLRLPTRPDLPHGDGGASHQTQRRDAAAQTEAKDSMHV